MIVYLFDALEETIILWFLQKYLKILASYDSFNIHPFYYYVTENLKNKKKLQQCYDCFEAP